MSDQDTSHLLAELQGARYEIDLLRKTINEKKHQIEMLILSDSFDERKKENLKLKEAIRKHIEAMKPYKGAYYDLELWAVLDSLPGEGGSDE